MTCTNAQYKHLKGAKFIHLNIRSLFGKIDEFRHYVSIYKPSVIALCETWLNKDIDDIEINLENYKVFRSDRSIGTGGGVLFYVLEKSTLECEIYQIDTELEQISLKLKFFRSKCFYISCVYRRPTDSSFIENYKTFLLKFVNNEHLIFGDFNYDLKKEENDFWREINELLGYKQLINDTTRLTSTSATLIDHIFTNKTENTTRLQCFCAIFILTTI
jgi:hypothetical protein